MEHSAQQLADSLRQAGHRLTQPRWAVMQVLERNDQVLDPAAICAQARSLCPSVGLVTVYRTLELLTDLGLVRRVHSEQRCHSYALSAADRHHLVCEGCHRVLEFPCGGLDGLIDAVRQDTGYTVTAHLLELTGLCPDCQACLEA